MTLAKAKAKSSETFIVQASLAIFIYNRQIIFIAQATGQDSVSKILFFKLADTESLNAGFSLTKDSVGPHMLSTLPMMGTYLWLKMYRKLDQYLESGTS
jgi:hypothetical protein